MSAMQITVDESTVDRVIGFTEDGLALAEAKRQSIGDSAVFHCEELIAKTWRFSGKKEGLVRVRDWMRSIGVVKFMVTTQGMWDGKAAR